MKSGLIWEPREVRKHFVILCKRVNNAEGGEEVITEDNIRTWVMCCSQKITLHVTIQQDCNSANKQAWTNNNALPCTDNKACTKSDRCSNGVCSGTLFTCLSCEECYNDACRVKPGFCVINDGGSRTCFNHGDLRPGYPCQVTQFDNYCIHSTCDQLISSQYVDISLLIHVGG